MESSPPAPSAKERLVLCTRAAGPLRDFPATGQLQEGRGQHSRASDRSGLKELERKVALPCRVCSGEAEPPETGSSPPPAPRPACGTPPPAEEGAGFCLPVDDCGALSHVAFPRAFHEQRTHGHRALSLHWDGTSLVTFRLSRAVTDGVQLRFPQSPPSSHHGFFLP